MLGSRPRFLAAVLVLAGCSKPNPAFEVPLPTGGDGSTSTTNPGSGSTTDDPTTTTTGMDPSSTSAVSTSTTSTPGTTTTGVEPMTVTGPDTSSGTGTSTSTGVRATCGDGVLDSGEECDLGDGGNSDDGACTLSCKLAVCGDGLVKLAGDAPEDCDEGPDNSDEGGCTSACKLATCGDGLVNKFGPGPLEHCDAGFLNGSGPGACSTDCKAVIADTKRYIRVATQPKVKGNLRHPQGQIANGIAAGDEACRLVFGETYEILAVDGANRRATVDPHVGGEQALNWPIQPYTAYYNKSDQLVWITGENRLLGVENGAEVELLHPLDAQFAAWTGLLPTWQTSGETCTGWTTTNVNQHGQIANVGLLKGFLDFGIGNCGDILGLAFICVENP